MVRIYLPLITEGFVNIGKSYRGLRTLSIFFACLSSYFMRYFAYIVPWLIVVYYRATLYPTRSLRLCSFLPAFNTILYILG